ncbi:hypothetical protein D3C79_1055440 [compost metagenome]
MIVEIPVGNHVVLPQQHPVQGARRSHLVFATLGGQQGVEQVIDHRVFHASIVLAALGRGLA